MPDSYTGGSPGERSMMAAPSRAVTSRFIRAVFMTAPGAPLELRDVPARGRARRRRARDDRERGLRHGRPPASRAPLGRSVPDHPGPRQRRRVAETNGPLADVEGGRSRRRRSSRSTTSTARAARAGTASSRARRRAARTGGSTASPAPASRGSARRLERAIEILPGVRLAPLPDGLGPRISWAAAAACRRGSTRSSARASRWATPSSSRAAVRSA
jgi:hypothetical protein